jgi:hypothetical protein
MNGTTPLVGIRQEFDHDLGTSIRPEYFILIDGPEAEFPSDRFWVEDGAPMIGERQDGLEPFREASYVLFSMRGITELTDTDTLPFRETVSLVIELSASAEEADWKRAKAELVVLLRQLLTSPDLTREQALRYHDNVVRQAKEAHLHASNIGTLGRHDATTILDDLRQAVTLLELP